MVIQPDSTDAFERRYHLPPFLASVLAALRRAKRDSLVRFASAFRVLGVPSPASPDGCSEPRSIDGTREAQPITFGENWTPIPPGGDSARGPRHGVVHDGGASTSGARGKQTAPPLYQMTDCPSQARAPPPNAPEDGRTPVYHIRQPPVNCSRTTPLAIRRLGTAGGKSDRRQSSTDQTALPQRIPTSPIHSHQVVCPAIP